MKAEEESEAAWLRTLAELPRNSDAKTLPLTREETAARIRVSYVHLRPG